VEITNLGAIIRLACHFSAPTSRGFPDLCQGMLSMCCTDIAVETLEKRRNYRLSTPLPTASNRTLVPNKVVLVSANIPPIIIEPVELS